MTTAGKCLCGQITVSVPKEAISPHANTGICHCKNCCQSSGSLGSISAIIPESNVQIEGQPKVYQDTNTDSGKAVQRFFCGNCGSPIYSTSPNMPGIRVVRLPLFDSIPKPAMELFCKSMPSWSKPIEGTKQFDAMPTK